jgi:hypothetical protein
MGYGLGDNTVISDQGSESPFGALSTATIAAQCGSFYSISKRENRFWADGAAWCRVNQTLDVRDTLVWLADEPPRPNPQSKAAYSQTALWLVGNGVRGGVCGFAAAIADAGVCARARAAVRTGRHYLMSEYPDV